MHIAHTLWQAFIKFTGLAPQQAAKLLGHFDVQPRAMTRPTASEAKGWRGGYSKAAVWATGQAANR